MSDTQGFLHRRWVKIVAVVLLIVLILAVIAVAFSMCTPAPTAPVTPENTPVPTEAQPQDNSWNQVQSSGVLRVGTAADNPPFTYLDETYAISGFDAALIRAVGQRLGVAVEITDFAFNGLLGALQVNQVDAVIAALSVTPQREALVDFSNVYYFGEEGVLVSEDSIIEKVITLDQFKGQRVGVQRLSIYEKWLREELVNTGKLPPENLFVYAKPEHAVRDLSSNFLDVVVLDEQTAVLQSSTSGVRFVKSGLYPQRFAIAVNLGATELQNRLNQALTEIQNDGTLNNLKQTYLGLEPQVNAPTATPEPEEEDCVDAMVFVSDLTYDDQNLTYFPDFIPNEPFQKGWRIKNNGTCTWTIAYSARFVYGTTSQSDMRGQPTALNREVAPGETYDLFVNLVAPDASAPGRHVGNWQMFNSDGEAFGQSIWVAINVVVDGGGVTPTTQPTTNPTVQPTIQPTTKPTAQPTVQPTPEPTPLPDPGAEIKNKPWYLIKYFDETELVEPIVGTDIHIELDTNNQLSGSAGCNSISSKYLIDGKWMSITGIKSGLLYCQKPEGVMAQEGIIIELLQYTTEWRLKEGDLELLRRMNNEEEVLLVFTYKNPR